MQLLFESRQENGPGLQHASAAVPEGPWKYLKIIPKPLSIKAAVATNHKICSNFLFLYDGIPIFTHAISGLEDWAAMENAFQEFDGFVRSCTWSRNRSDSQDNNLLIEVQHCSCKTRSESFDHV